MKRILVINPLRRWIMKDWRGSSGRIGGCSAIQTPTAPSRSARIGRGAGIQEVGRKALVR